MNIICHLSFTLWFSLLLATSCWAQSNSPADQLIKGSFAISKDWNTIRFYKPLESTPHTQSFQLLFCNNQMDFINLRPDEVRTPENSGDFKRTIDNKILELEVIVHNGKKEYHLPQTSNGSYYAGKGAGCLFIGYRLEGKDMEIFLPQGTRFFFAKIRANIPITIDRLYWTASYYERSPNRKWSDIHPSRIIDIK